MPSHSIGYWPLYRWNPSKSIEERFLLDSAKLKSSIQEFLSRQQNLANFIQESESLAVAYSSTASFVSRDHFKKHSDIVDSFLRLQARLKGTGESLLILFGSDGGNAESLANRLSNTAVASLGFSAKCHPMDEFDVEELGNQKTVVFVVSTAGQGQISYIIMFLTELGEFPVNAKEFWKRASTVNVNLENTRYAVFALGDKNYWPRPEDYIYFCKPGILVKLKSNLRKGRI